MGKPRIIKRPSAWQVLLASGLLLALGHPWIIGFILGKGASLADARIERVAVNGYQSLTLHAFAFAAPSVEAGAQSLTLPLPLAILRWLMADSAAQTPPQLTADGWLLRLSETAAAPDEPATAEPPSPEDVTAQIHHLLAKARAWKLHFLLRDGHLQGFGADLAVPELRLRGDSLDGRYRLVLPKPALETAGSFAARLSPDQLEASLQLQSHFDSPDFPSPAEADLVVRFFKETTSAPVINLQGTLAHPLANGTVSAQFANSWLFSRAQISLKGQKLSSQLPGIPSLLPETLDLQGDWDGNQWQLQADASGQTNLSAILPSPEKRQPAASPEPPSSAFIPWSLSIAGRGDRSSAVLENLEFLTADRSASIQATGSYHLDQKNFQLDIPRILIEASSFAAWFPPELSLQKLSGNLQIEGRIPEWTNLQLASSLRLHQLQRPQATPVDLDLRLHMNGLEKVDTHIEMLATRTDQPPVTLGQLDLLGGLQLQDSRLDEATAMQWQLSGSLPLDDSRQLTAGLLLKGNQDGLRLSDLNVSGRELWLEGEAFWPIHLIRQNGSLRLHWIGQQNGHLSLQGQLGQWMRERLLHATGANLQEARFQLKGTGQPHNFDLQLTASANRLEIPTPQTVLGQNRLQFDDLALALTANTEALSLDKGSFIYNEQPFQINALLPISTEMLNDLLAGRTPDPDSLFDSLSGQIQATDFPLEPLALYLPEWLTRQGSLSLDFQLSPGRQLSGTLQANSLITRPLPNGSPLAAESILLRIQNRKLSIENWNARLGQQPIRLAGEASLQQWPAIEASLHLTGQNLPLLRQPDLLLRGDLDLTLQLPLTEPASLSGRIHLHNGLLVSNLNTFLQNNPASPATRPPWFAIETPPVADWRLAIDLLGESFMQIQSPLFRARLSTRMTLQGRLAEPLLTGTVYIDEGTIPFPFTSLRITSGEASLNRTNPYAINLLARAEGSTMGYSLFMDVSGTASNPEIRFTADPPLAQEEALLLLTAGVLPKGGTPSNASTSNARTQRLAIFLGQSLIDELISSPSNSSSSGSIAERLRIESGQNVSERGRETYQIEFNLDDEWSILGEYDQYDAYNLGLKWNLYSK